MTWINSNRFFFSLLLRGGGGVLCIQVSIPKLGGSLWADQGLSVLSEEPSKLEHECCLLNTVFRRPAGENSTSKWEQWSNLLCLHIGTLKGPAAIKYQQSQHASLTRFTKLMLSRVSSESQSLCVFCTTDRRFLPNFLKRTHTFLGMEEENGVLLGIYFLTLPTRAHWPAGWMPATSPSFLCEKNLSARFTSWRELIFQQSGLIWVNN